MLKSIPWARNRSALRSGPAPGRSRSLIGFGVLHSGNTLLNMGFTLVQLLVLARILPIARYSEVVFLMSVGFYFQPFDQAVGKANFVALRSEAVQAGRARARPELVAVLAAQASLLLIASVAIPSAFAPLGSAAWVEDVLFLFLCLAVNFWAFDLQSTAWSVDRNVAFVRLSIVHRTLHMGALLVAFLTGSFLWFGVLAASATLLCLSVVARMFATAGLFDLRDARSDWADYARIFRVSFLSTLTDFLVMNAAYMLIAARFGIGPMLIVFDSVMKIARIAMAGSRTLAEIALPRHSGHVASGRLKQGQTLFLQVLTLCVGATLIPAAAVAFAGPKLFHLLLGANDVVPASAMPYAALVILASGLYQPAVFFLGYGNQRGPVQAMTLLAAAAFAAFAAILYTLPMGPGAVLGLFGCFFLGLGLVAAVFTNRLFTENRTVPASDRPAMSRPEQIESPA